MKANRVFLSLLSERRRPRTLAAQVGHVGSYRFDIEQPLGLIDDLRQRPPQIAHVNTHSGRDLFDAQLVALNSEAQLLVAVVGLFEQFRERGVVGFVVTKLPVFFAALADTRKLPLEGGFVKALLGEKVLENPCVARFVVGLQAGYPLLLVFALGDDLPVIEVQVDDARAQLAGPPVRIRRVGAGQ